MGDLSRNIAFTLFTMIVGIGVFKSNFVFAEAVYVEAEDQIGQGLAFNFQNSCLVLTAAHVVGAKGSLVQVVGRGGDHFEAEVIAQDGDKDLALLVLLIAGKPKVVHSSHTCYLGGGGALNTHGEIISGRKLAEVDGAKVGWVDRVPSASGGLERLIVDGYFEYSDSSIILKTKGAYPLLKGDSGAAVFFSFTGPTSEIRRSGREEQLIKRLFARRKGKLNARPRGAFLGIVRSITATGVKVVPAEMINDFVFKALTGMEWSSIRVEPDSVSIVDRRRGPLAGTANGRNGLLNVLATDSIGLEIDLGSRDFLLASIEVEYSAPVNKRDNGRASSLFPVGIWASASRPSEKVSDERGRYEREKCTPTLPTSAASTLSAKYKGRYLSFSCVLNSPKVVRAVKLVVVGKPEKIRVIRLKKAGDN